MEGATDPFDSPAPDRDPSRSPLLLTLDGFEGPIDMLLALAREQKVDLTRISILELADQYLGFVARARALDLGLAADYLVMAAWLAWLKSRLLLPDASGEEEEPSPAELAEALRLRLRRLEAMREAGDRLMARPRLGVDLFARGAPESLADLPRPVYEATLYDLLRAYADHRLRRDNATLRIAPTRLLSVEAAVERLRRMLGGAPGWRTLSAFLPAAAGGPLAARSAIASTFVAGLHLAKEGRAELRQDGAFGPIWLRPRGPGAAEPDG